MQSQLFKAKYYKYYFIHAAKIKKKKIMPQTLLENKINFTQSQATENKHI